MRPLPNYIKRDIYGIPYIEKQNIDIRGLNNTKWLINLKNVRTSDRNADRKIGRITILLSIFKKQQNIMQLLLLIFLCTKIWTLKTYYLQLMTIDGLEHLCNLSEEKS